MRYWLVMPAAGASRRFGAPQPKQYAPLGERTVIEWALAPFRDDARCAGIVLVLASDDEAWAALDSRARSAASATAAPTLSTVTGGAERSLSVRRGLEALRAHAQDADWVLVHDAARPCLERSDLERLLSGAAAHGVGGLLAVPVADTLKRGAGAADGAVEAAETVDRAGLWRALTPQMFRYGRLCAALDAAHREERFPTDEAQALEWQGERPALVKGLATNLKVTTFADLALAEALLRARQAGPRYAEQ